MLTMIVCSHCRNDIYLPRVHSRNYYNIKILLFSSMCCMMMRYQVPIWKPKASASSIYCSKLPLINTPAHQKELLEFNLTFQITVVELITLAFITQRTTTSHLIDVSWKNIN